MILKLSIFLYYVVIGEVFCKTEDFVAHLSGSVCFENCCDSGEHQNWKFDNQILFFNKITVFSNFNGTVWLSLNKSVIIYPVQLLHEGTYECVCGTTTTKNYTLIVQVPPKMSLLLDNTKINQSHLWALHNETINITCVASESRPSVNLSWIISDVTAHVTTQTNVGNPDNATFNSSTILSYTPEKQVENISCVASGVGSMRYEKYVSLFTYDLPVLYLSFERHPDETEVNERPEVERWRVTCYAVGGTPKAELMFHERSENVIELRPNETTSAISILAERQATSDPEIITCTSIQQLNDSDVITNISRVLETLHEETTSYPDQTYAATVVSLPFNLNKIQPLAIITAAAILCVVVLCTYVAILKKRSSMSANLSSSEDQNLRRPSHIQMDDLPQTDQSPLKKPSQGSLREKPKSDLPSIPSENNSVNSNGSESNYYSAAKEGVEKERLFSEKDFCLLLSIRSGSIYKRWMGTIALSSTVNKCAVLTTMADMVTKKKVIQWESFVKRTLDLPKCDHITNIEGIGVDTTTLYLITEHVVCETMDNQLTCDPDSIGTKAPITVPDVMKHISGILEGMELIESYGFLHPGLSTKKVLYTKNGICKLYDFCLAEDAPKIVTLKKEQMSSFNLNQFPPESLFRNEYTSESDVWSTAVVIWEILSSGMAPFSDESEVKPGEDPQTSPTLSWPQRYLQLRNITLFECWKQDCSLRPSIRQLRASFKSIFETLIENSLYEIPLSGLYTPMKGTTV